MRSSHKQSEYGLQSNLPFVRLFGKDKDDFDSPALTYLPELMALTALVWSLLAWPLPIKTTIEFVIFGLWVVIFGFLIALATANVKTNLLPNAILKPLVIVVLGYQVMLSIYSSNASVLFEAVIGGILLWVIPYIIFQVSAGKWIGGGDVKTSFAAGLLLGWKVALLCLALVATITGLFLLIGYLDNKLGANRSLVPTGIIWASTIIFCVLYGSRIIS